MLLLLKFFAGCWWLEGKITRSEEIWGRPGAGMMMGFSRTMRGDRTVEFEYIRIEPRDGVLVYVPTIRGKETVFKAAKVGANEAVFENPEHDFPQRIIYRGGGDSLTARIESMDGNREWNSLTSARRARRNNAMRLESAADDPNLAAQEVGAAVGRKSQAAVDGVDF